MDRMQEQAERLRAALLARIESSGVPADRIVLESLDYMLLHLHRPLGVNELVGKSLVVRRTLERRFRAALGASIYQTICWCRLERAKQMLATTDWPIAQVAESAGYSDVSQLNYWFRQELALTPRNYRKQCLAALATTSKNNATLDAAQSADCDADIAG